MTILEEICYTLEDYLHTVDDIRKSTEDKDLLQFRLGYEYGLKVALTTINRIALEHAVGATRPLKSTENA